MIQTRWHLFVFLITALCIGSCRQPATGPGDKEASKEGQFMGQDYPGSTPSLFSPGLVSTRRNERDFALSPDGKEIFYSYPLPGYSLSSILTMKQEGTTWQDPDVAFFSGVFSDLEPAFSPDGSRLYFVSKRPVADTDSTHDWNIWFLERQGPGWNGPAVLGPPVNDEGNEFYPSVAASGNLYFTGESRGESRGEEDIYVSLFQDGIFSAPVNLGEGVNSRFPEYNAFVAADESYLIFSSSGREDDLGGGDLYISFSDANGKWNAAKNLGRGINSDKLDYCPFVTGDGRYLFFTSHRLDQRISDLNKKNLQELMNLDDSQANGLGDIYWVEFDPENYR